MKILKKILYSITNNLLGITGYMLIKREMYNPINVEKFKENKQKFSSEHFIKFIFKNKQDSRSQIFQDLFVDYILKKKRGYFCEIGAADGVSLSNTYYLEKKLKWKGILCEPSIYWKNKLKKNRKNSLIIFNAIDGFDGNKLFHENSSQFLSGFKKTNKKSYMVKTLSLNTILQKIFFL